MRAEQLTEPLAGHGEGPVWDADAGVLRWVDLLVGDVLTLGPAGTVARRHVGDVAAAFRPRAGGGMVVAVERGFVVVDADGHVGPVHEAFTDADVRMNDGGCDPAGRFFCGSMAYDAAPGRGALYRFDPDGTVTRALDGVTISNGIAWTPDGSTVFYVDTPTGRIDAFDYDLGSAALTDRRPVVHVDPVQGQPDGLALDAEGGLWVALWQGGAVHRYTQDGRLDQVIELPARQVTACAFGGPDRDRLFVTTSRDGLSDPEPAAGAVFVADVGVPGAPVAVFAG
ncbi:SMP-30/gluconolactonase/LRE family protein [uncultured Cellulomonas sp.]|uniref:SMP-30/gluconolactonase/LRE family protein n=1 Tax=uncultured Cellulomonas sp. TaxID=189682 RepID=UPI00262F8225|nr:SMP-30/gluconolactonase/LRE family protein [uncultured Cellulomonas sp.]